MRAHCENMAGPPPVKGGRRHHEQPPGFTFREPRLTSGDQRLQNSFDQMRAGLAERILQRQHEFLRRRRP